MHQGPLYRGLLEKAQMSEHQSERQQMIPNLKPHVHLKTVGMGLQGSLHEEQ
jgi:hypothetical protein